jgi:tetratricopeptide (TPR) repeat protein
VQKQLRQTQEGTAGYIRTLARTAQAFQDLGYSEHAGRFMESASQACPSMEAQVTQDTIILELQLYRARQEIASDRADVGLALLTEAEQQAQTLMKREVDAATALAEDSQSSPSVQELVYHIGTLKAEALAAVGDPSQAIKLASQVWRNVQHTYGVVPPPEQLATASGTGQAEGEHQRRKKRSEHANDSADADADVSFQGEDVEAVAGDPHAPDTGVGSVSAAPQAHLRWQLVNSFVASLQQLGQLYKLIGLPHTALVYLERAARFAEHVGGARAHAWLLLLIGETRCTMGDIDTAVRLLTRARLRLKEEDSAEASVGTRHLQLVLEAELCWREGQVKFAQGDVAAALGHYDAAADCLLALMDPRHVAAVAAGEPARSAADGSADPRTPLRVARLRLEGGTAQEAPATPRSRGRACALWSSRYVRLAGLRIMLQAELGQGSWQGLYQEAMRSPASASDRVWFLLSVARAKTRTQASLLQNAWQPPHCSAVAAATAAMSLLALASPTRQGNDDMVECDARPSVPTEQELNKLRVVDLRTELKALGLATAGRKAELIERLIKAAAEGHRMKGASHLTSPGPVVPDKNGCNADEPSALDLLQMARAQGVAATDAICRRQLHFTMAQVIGRSDPVRAFYHHHQAMGVSLRLDTDSGGNDCDATVEQFLAALDAARLPATVVGLGHDEHGQLIVSKYTHENRVPLLLHRLVGTPRDTSSSLEMRLAESDDADEEKCTAPGRKNAILQHVARMATVAVENTQSITAPTKTEKDKEAWWKRRRALDTHLGRILADIEACFLGPWRGIVLGSFCDERCAHRLATEVRRWSEETWS